MRVDGGLSGVALPEPLEEWFDDYARSLARRKRSPTTTKAYHKSYVRFWRWALSNGTDPDPAEVSYRTINAWTDHLGEEVSPGTVAILWRNLRPFFSWWAKEVDADTPPSESVHPRDVPGIPETLVRIVDLDDVRKLLAVCSGKGFDDRRDNAVIRVFVDCGVRLGELVTMRLADWNRKSDLLTSTASPVHRRPPRPRHRPSVGEVSARPC